VGFLHPHVATVPPGQPFINAIAAGLINDFSDSPPEALADVTVLLPTRRATRSLREAFLSLSHGKALLLPRIHAIGDVGEDEFSANESGTTDKFNHALDSMLPAISPPQRKLLIAQLIHKWWSIQTNGTGGTFDQAIHVSSGFARLLDQFQAARLDMALLDTLVPEEHAAHWQETIDFIRIISEQWPTLLSERGVIDQGMRRNLMLENLTVLWRDSPPETPVVAAGSTGSLPATADLLTVIAKLPRGCVLLPGLDQNLDDKSWQTLEETHPQYALKRLLKRLNIDRKEVQVWGNKENRAEATHRSQLLSELMRPEATVDAWHKLGTPNRAAIQGLRSITCPDLATEATTIAMMMRETIEIAGLTVALVTPDRELAQRVKVELRRWNLDVDDSAGIALADTTAGVFLRLVASMASAQAAPIPALAMLKHHLCSAGMTHESFRDHVATIERATLRGPRPGPGFQGILNAAREANVTGKTLTLLQSIASAGKHLLSLTSSASVPLADILVSHVAFAQWLAADTHGNGEGRLWREEGGETARMLLEEVISTSRNTSPVCGHDYGAIFDKLLADTAIHVNHAEQKRLCIWGPLESRLQHADLVIIGELNEGTWPRRSDTDAWLNRPMRQSLGMMTPEQMVGLSAHDFGQLFCAPNVALIRSVKKAGSETIPSRWLVRLNAILHRAGLEETVDNSAYWTTLVDLLDKTHSERKQILPPAPCPPISARPRRLSVTRIERWMQDPYDIFAREILQLRPLDPIDAAPDAADYGSAVHAALDSFVRRYPKQLPDKALQHLLSIGKDCFGPALAKPSVHIFWWPRFERIASWFIELEQSRRLNLVQSFSEQHGQLQIDAPGGSFTLTAKADRIDLRVDGTLDIIDYKTGSLPSKAKVYSGEAPQLALEAAIANNGGFDNLPNATSRALVHVRLSGGKPAGDWQMIDQNIPSLAAEASSGLAQLVAAFDDESIPYHAVPSADRAPRHSNYTHLARVSEWSSNGEDV